ncbi:MAG: PQQ-binding-like beta-propeller repeat protein [Gemmatimonadaceae bacterium]|nr:PQQ-binding-like beta-propeller repeat protein [Gemmatimonadaceae bacterium]
MPRRKPSPLYIGIGSHVVALDATSGEEIWRTKIKSSSFVTVCVIDSAVYAGAGGELFCLNARSGETVWTNKLKGLGHGLIAFAGADASAAASAQMMQASQAATTAAVVAATA